LSNIVSCGRQKNKGKPADMTDPLKSLAGRKGWIISDGKAGNDTQTRGVFDAMGLDYQVKRVGPTGIWKALAPWGPVSPSERFGSAASTFAPPWPDFAVSCGRLTTPYIRKLKQKAGFSTYTIILQDPKVAARTADLFWVPDHDKRRGINVITTLTAPHSFSPQRLQALRAKMPPDIAALPAPRVAVSIGGPNGDFRYTPEAQARLVSALGSLVALGAGLMVTASRRTPPQIAEAVRAAVADAHHVFWDGHGENPYPEFLAHADALIVPGDSVNMTGEACATGRPVYVFEPEGGSAKFMRFHEALRRYGATRPMPAHFEQLDTWSYRPLSSAETIATEIARRWNKRRQMLGPAS
jgi:uncharacterized protein